MQESQVEKIKAKIDLWESMYAEADTSLYTLGLRHAIDILTNQTATDFNGFDGSKYEKEQMEGRDTVWSQNIQNDQKSGQP